MSSFFKVLSITSNQRKFQRSVNMGDGNSRLKMNKIVLLELKQSLINFTNYFLDVVIYILNCSPL